MSRTVKTEYSKPCTHNVIIKRAGRISRRRDDRAFALAGMNDHMHDDEGLFAADNEFATVFRMGTY